MRFSLQFLFWAIALCAFTVAALLNANRPWHYTTKTVLFLFLCSSVVGVVLCREPARAMWIGAAVFSWTYFVFGTVGIFDNPPFHYSLPWYCSTILIRWIMQDRQLVVAAASELMYPIQNIVQSLWTIYFGIIGGAIARWMYLRHVSRA